MSSGSTTGYSSLLNFDQVSAISQQTLNTQISLLAGMGLITDTIDFEADADNYFRATIDTPTIDVCIGDTTIDPTKVMLTVSILSGSAQGKVVTETIGCDDLSGYRARFQVNLGAADPLNDSSLLLSDAAKEKLNGFDRNIYSMTSIILDVNNINYSDNCTMIKPNGSEDGQLEFLLPILMGAMIEDGNPFLITLNPMYLAGSGQMESVDGFIPTSMNYRTQFYNNVNASSGLNSLNLMVMNEGHTAPTIDSRQEYPINLGPTSSSPDGYFYISYAQFYNNYFKPHVLTVLADAFGNKASFNYSNGTYTYNWHYSNAGDDPNGSDKGPIVADDGGIDVHQTIQKYVYCVLSDPKSGPDGNVIIEASGYLRGDVDYYEYFWPFWIHTAQSQVKEDFNFTISLYPGDEGRITISVDGSHQPGTINGETSPHLWTNIAVSFGEWIGSIFGSDKWYDDTINDIKDETESMLNSAITGFQNDVPELFSALSEQIILPTGKAYIFNSVQINDEGDAVFAFKINS